MAADLLSTLHIDVEELLEDLAVSWKENPDYKYNVTAFTKATNKGENIMCNCPYHEEEEPSFGIQTFYPYGFNCFGCGTSGNLAKLVAHVMGLPSELHGLRYIQKHYIVLSARDRPKLDIRSILDGGNELDKKRTLPESVIEKYVGKHHPYMIERGFSRHTLSKFEVGFDEEKGAVTFPVRTSKGLIRFINRRSVHTKSFLNEKNIYKKDILYGLYYILQSPNRITEIYLNESITDAMSCYEARLPACAVMGRILFEEQVREMLLAGIKTVNLFFDNDRYGVECTLRSQELLSKTPIRTNVVLYPIAHWGISSTNVEELPYKDANDLLKAKKMNDIRVVPFMQFKSMLSKEIIAELTKKN